MFKSTLTRKKIQTKIRDGLDERERGGGEQSTTLMDIQCGALGLCGISVHNVTKNTDTNTHKPEPTTDNSNLLELTDIHHHLCLPST